MECTIPVLPAHADLGCSARARVGTEAAGRILKPVRGGRQQKYSSASFTPVERTVRLDVLTAVRARSHRRAQQRPTYGAQPAWTLNPAFPGGSARRLVGMRSLQTAVLREMHKLVCAVFGGQAGTQAPWGWPDERGRERAELRMRKARRQGGAPSPAPSRHGRWPRSATRRAVRPRHARLWRAAARSGN